MNLIPFPSARVLPAASALETNERDVYSEHYAHPIKDVDTINRISKFLVSGKRYRDNAIFIIGINVGLRCSDLRELKVGDFLNADGTFKERFYLIESKTSHSRKLKQNRHITINSAVKEALTLLLKNKKEYSLDDYLFTGNSNRCAANTPLTRQSFDRIIKGIMADLNVEGRYATHTLRKTFGYHIMKQNNNDSRTLMLLQQIFGHSSSAITLRYIGFTEEEIDNTYKNLNLGVQNSIQPSYLATYTS